MTTTKPTTISQYIAGFPAETQALLEQVRQLVRKEVPAVEETISYGIPAFNLNGTYLIYFAGYSKHISIHPAPTADAAFKEDFAPYKTGKGTVQFPLGQPLPVPLIIKVLKYLIRSNQERARLKMI